MDSDALKAACKQAGILVEDRNYLSEPTARVEWDGPNGPSMHWLGFSNPALITFVAERLVEMVRAQDLQSNYAWQLQDNVQREYAPTAVAAFAWSPSCAIAQQRIAAAMAVLS